MAFIATDGRDLAGAMPARMPRGNGYKASDPASLFGKPVPTYGVGRRCEKCGALLSIYNPGSYCWSACLRGE